jgi:NADH:ubiquinone oxidoreductase subunit K
MPEPLLSYFAVSAILFAIGVYGLIAKRNAIRLIFAVEIIINAALLNFVAFSRYQPGPNITGQTVALFGIALAAAEAAVGLAIIMLAFRVHRDIDVLELRRLKG